MGIADNLGGLGDKLNDLKNEHGDQINEAVDNLQAQHSDKLGDNAGAVNDFIDNAQRDQLGQQQDAGQQQPVGEQQVNDQAAQQENQ